MLADRLRRVRKLKKLTQLELANKVKTTKATISNYENGYSTPSNEMLMDLAETLNVTTDYLLGRSNVLSNVSKEIPSKDEKDIAKRLKEIRNDLTSGGALSFNGEPMSEEAMESLMESMEYIVRQTQKINKKYIPKKYRKDEDNQ